LLYLVYMFCRFILLIVSELVFIVLLPNLHSSFPLNCFVCREDSCGAQARKAASKWRTLLVRSSFAETLMALLNSKTCFDSSFSRAQLHSLWSVSLSPAKLGPPRHTSPWAANHVVWLKYAYHSRPELSLTMVPIKLSMWYIWVSSFLVNYVLLYYSSFMCIIPEW
jgi:hypothetical protein